MDQEAHSSGEYFELHIYSLHYINYYSAYVIDFIQPIICGILQNMHQRA